MINQLVIYTASTMIYHFVCKTKKNTNMQQSKLIADLTNKYNYIIHYRNLEQCFQSDWLKKYIDSNNHHRTLAVNDFEKNFFKLLNNAVYGKTMENVDRRKAIKLVSSWVSDGKKLGARAPISKCNFKLAVYKKCISQSY